MKKVIRIILTILVVAVLLGLFLFYPRNYDNPKTDKNNPDSIRIMTYNIKNSYQDYEQYLERRSEIVTLINDYEPDVIGLQEADYEWMVYLEEHLGDYDYVGVGRDDGITAGEFAAIFYLKDRFRVVESGNFWLSETPDLPSLGWDANNIRICTWVTLEDKETNEMFTHYNTHLDHKGEKARTKSIELINEVLSDNEYPVILTGDMNFLEDSKYYNSIDSTINDSKDLAEDSMSFGTVNYFYNINFRYIKPIDFIFVSEDDFIVDRYAVVMNYRLEEEQISDHYPVFAELRFK